MNRTLVMGGAVAGLALALVGCGKRPLRSDAGAFGADGGPSVLDGGPSVLDGGPSVLDGGPSVPDGGPSSPDAGATGVVLTPPPPFTIPEPPPSFGFEPCDSLAAPAPVGFLADRRPVVGQPVQTDRPYVQATLVRAWDPRTNALERLFVAAASESTRGDILRVTRDGRRIIDAAPGRVRVYDVDRRVFASDATIAATVRAVSDRGDFLLDGNLRRYTASGEADFDFKPLVPTDLRVIGEAEFPVALSSSGEAAAAIAVEPVMQKWFALAVYQDGRVIRLPDSPVTTFCARCGLSWSADGRYLLGWGGNSLRVWDTGTAQLIGRVDGAVAAAAFSPDGGRVVTSDDNGALAERDLSGAVTAAWTIWGDARTAFGSEGRVLGFESSGLVLTSGALTEARWRQPGTSWPGGLAVTPTAAFAIVFDWEPPPGGGPFFLMLARFELGHAGPTAVLRPNEFQSEYVGQVALSPDEQRVAVVFPDSTRILDAATLAPLAVIPGSAGQIAWSPDGRYLAASPDYHYRDGGRPAYLPRKEVTVWNVPSGTLAARIGTPVYPQGIAFDERGATVAGWGRPTLYENRPDPGVTGQVHTFGLSGDAAGFTIDLVSSTVTAASMPPFVAATRELVATESSIVRLSSGTTLSAIAAPPISHGAFAPDFSLLLAVDKSEDPSAARVRVAKVATGATIASIATTSNSYPAAPLAVSRGGRVAAVSGDFYCAR